MKHLIIYTLFLTTLLISSCKHNNPNTNNNKPTTTNQQQTTTKSHFNLQITPNNNATNTCGDIYQLNILCDTTITPDSVRYLIDSKPITTTYTNHNYTLNTQNLRTGNILLSAEVYYNNHTEYLSGKIQLKSDITPQRLTYKIIKTYPHDNEAYTQGLLYENGFLYESTGLTQKSSLRKVKLENGDIIQSIALNDKYFGEGLAIDNNHLIQITWKNHKAFVYDKNTFETINEFDIPTEGWGLVMHNDTLILTDGTENLYFMNKNTFSTSKITQVYDNNGPVKLLNELEIINNQLYANIYQSDIVAVIDIPTGKVLKYIDFTGLLAANLYKDNTDVLNGIAYDNTQNRIFVTGKNWPLIFQIEIKE